MFGYVRLETCTYVALRELARIRGQRVGDLASRIISQHVEHCLDKETKDQLRAGVQRHWDEFKTTAQLIREDHEARRVEAAQRKT